MPDYALVGKRIPRKDTGDKASGRVQYGADFALPGMLVGKILRSPYPHARIVGIDTSRAERLAGVKAILTARDTPGVQIGRWVQDRPVLAMGVVRHVGEPVAAIAAVDRETAEEAAELIRVTYEDLPAVFDVLEAMEEGAPLVHERLAEYAAMPFPHRPQGNILMPGRRQVGDVETAWAVCDLIHEERYRTQTVYQACLQTQEVTGAVDGQGRVTLWASTKAPFLIREGVARALELPMSRLRVIAAGVGGDFGAKGTANPEPICALLAMKTGKPVRLAFSRKEDFAGTFMRTSSVIELKMGAKRDGTLVAHQARIVYDTGAYCDSFGRVEKGDPVLLGPYRVPHVDQTSYLVYTNNPPRGHMRAPRHPQPTFAVESHLDAMAAMLGLDPVEMRLRNALHDGDAHPEGGKLRNSGLKTALETVAGYVAEAKAASAGPNRGWGFGCGQFGMRVGHTPTASSAVVKLNEDGTVVLLSGITEQGCGPVSIVAQIVGEVLGVPYENVSVVSADTDATPYEQGTGGSATTHRVGTTVKLAAEDAKRQLLALAAEKLEARAEDLRVGNGLVYVAGVPERAVSNAQLARISMSSAGGPIVGNSGALREEYLAAAKKDAGAIDGPEFGAHAAQVEVDPETGEVRVLRYLAAHDVGFAINPLSVEGQIQGAVACGLGYALSEEVLLEKGRPVNADLRDYRLLNATSAPDVDMAIIEIPSRYGPYGAKGCGEIPCVPVAAVIANAVFDAVGVRITELPLTPERVHRAIKQGLGVGDRSPTTPNP